MQEGYVPRDVRGSVRERSCEEPYRCDGVAVLGLQDRYLAAAAAAVEKGDAAGLAELLRAADAAMPDTTTLRYSTAIRAMMMRQYECGAAAWDDGGSVWSDIRAEPGIPTSRESALAMGGACAELAALRRVEARAGELRRAEELRMDVDALGPMLARRL
jgi:hypothetical protein